MIKDAYFLEVFFLAQTKVEHSQFVYQDQLELYLHQ